MSLICPSSRRSPWWPAGSGRRAPEVTGRLRAVETDRAGAALCRTLARRMDPTSTQPVTDHSSDEGVESNARLTGSTAAILLVLLAAEGVTILRIHALLTAHVVVGMLLVPPVLLKIGSTGWRFVRYYRGTAAYRRKGPPPWPLRLLGPVVVVLTVVLFASGIYLLLDRHGLGDHLALIHKASFVLWFGAMTVHVVGHLFETARLAPLDWAHRTRRDVAGASARQWALIISLVVGVLLGVLMLAPTHHYAHG